MNNLEDEGNDSVKNQYLLFLLDKTLYAIEALHAQEIVEYTQITKVPTMTSSVKGVTNIRGNIVPVIDLMERFNIGKTTIGTKTSIIVMNYNNGEDKIQMGVLIDEVYEVDDIDTSNLKETPKFGSKVDKKFIKKMGRYEKDYIPILDMKVILDIEELSKSVS
ncbi:chemotaxis protein CheW [Sulfurimonas sp.]|nr:chemotaxis protein CheW [Sulfurimonas sp.]